MYHYLCEWNLILLTWSAWFGSGGLPNPPAFLTHIQRIAKRNNNWWDPEKKTQGFFHWCLMNLSTVNLPRRTEFLYRKNVFFGLPLISRQASKSTIPGPSSISASHLVISSWMQTFRWHLPKLLLIWVNPFRWKKQRVELPFYLSFKHLM